MNLERNHQPDKENSTFTLKALVNKKWQMLTKK